MSISVAVGCFYEAMKWSDTFEFVRDSAFPIDYRGGKSSVCPYTLPSMCPRKINCHSLDYYLDFRSDRESGGKVNRFRRESLERDDRWTGFTPNRRNRSDSQY